jgi:hypothetical protein
MAWQCVFGLERVEALLSVWLALWGWSLGLGSPPFRQSPLQTPEVSGSLLYVLSVPAVSGPAKGHLFPYVRGDNGLVSPAVTGRQLMVWIDRPLCNETHTHPLRGWGPLQRSCVCTPCNPFFFFFLHPASFCRPLCVQTHTRSVDTRQPLTAHVLGLCAITSC